MKYWSVFILTICMYPIDAQISVTGAFDRDTVRLGESSMFTLSIKTSGGEEILAIPDAFLDSIYSALQTFKINPGDTTGSTPPQIADFEMLSLGQWQENDMDNLFAGEELKWNINNIGSQVLYENSFTLQFWDPGNNIILLPPVVYALNGEQQQYYEGGQVEIFVAPPVGVESVNQDSLEIEPIKPILIEAKNLSDYLIYFYILTGILISILLYYLVQKWNNRKEAPKEIIVQPEIYVPPHERALHALSQLREEQLWQKGEIKEYQSRLTYIIREYLENRYHVPALESTTDEIVKNIKAAKMDLSDIDSLKRILQVADLVKFAKAQPDESIHDTFMNEAEEFVDRTKEIITEEGEEDE